jgi:hypothetical protein
MKTRVLFFAVLVLAFFSSSASAGDTVYKISLSDGGVILSSTAPVASGSMLLVKNLSDGSLTGVPAELVSNVSKARTADTALGTKPIKNLVPASRLVTLTDFAAGSKSVIVLLAGQEVSGTLATAKMAGTLTSANLPATLATGKSKQLSGSVSAAKTESGLALSVSTAKTASGSDKGLTMKLMTPLDPGQRVFLGPTGGTSTAATRMDTIVVPAPAGASAGFALSVDPLRASIQDKVFAGDLPRLTPRSGLTAGTFAPTTGDTVIGPNGFPPATSPVSQTGLARAGGAITSALPVTATAATTGAIGVSATSGAANGVAPAAASPR